MAREKEEEKEQITISIDSWMLAFMRRYCKKHDVTMSQAFNKGGKILLAIDLALSCFFWRKLYDTFGNDDQL